MTKKPDTPKKQKTPKTIRVLDERDHQVRSSIKNLTAGMSAEQSDLKRQEVEAVRRVSALLLRRLKESYKNTGEEANETTRPDQSSV